MESGKKIVLVTGATAGIGINTVRKMLQSRASYHILLGGRSKTRIKAATEELKDDAERGSNTVEGVILDIRQDENIKALAQSIDQKKWPTRCSAVQCGQMSQLGIGARDMFAQTWDTNVTGIHLLIEALAPLLLRSNDPRLLFFTSGTASLAVTEDDTFILNKVPGAGWPKEMFRELPAYKSSKLAINMVMRDWERILRADGVKVWSVNPGFFATTLGKNPSLMRSLGHLNGSKAVGSSWKSLKGIMMTRQAR